MIDETFQLAAITYLSIIYLAAWASKLGKIKSNELLEEELYSQVKIWLLSRGVKNV